MKIQIIFILVLLNLNLASAALLYGEVYDVSLEPLTNVIVEINTEPKQVKVSKDGVYEFELNPGDYVIKAAYSNDVDLYYEQNVSIKDKNGKYNIDLILLPLLEEEDFEDISDVFEEEKREASPGLIIILIIISLFSLLYLFNWFKSNKKVVHEEIKEKSEGDLDELINFIKKEGGRVTQKDIRKRFPLSEAKISLMISELEHKGIVEKIKKGRGNIIILKK